MKFEISKENIAAAYQIIKCLSDPKMSISKKNLTILGIDIAHICMIEAKIKIKGQCGCEPFWLDEIDILKTICKLAKKDEIIKIKIEDREIEACFEDGFILKYDVVRMSELSHTPELPGINYISRYNVELKEFDKILDLGRSDFLIIFEKGDERLKISSGMMTGQSIYHEIGRFSRKLNGGEEFTKTAYDFEFLSEFLCSIRKIDRDFSLKIDFSSDIRPMRIKTENRDVNICYVLAPREMRE